LQTWEKRVFIFLTTPNWRYLRTIIDPRDGETLIQDRRSLSLKQLRRCRMPGRNWPDRNESVARLLAKLIALGLIIDVEFGNSQCGWVEFDFPRLDMLSGDLFR